MATCRGIDVSNNQGAQDWKTWKKQGLTFAFAKASEGEHTHDSRFAVHIKGIKGAGLVPGAYHFAWPNQSAAVEAANYISAVKPYAGRGFIHWLDLERYPDGRNYQGRTAAQIKAYAAAWVAAVQHAFPGQRVGIYTSASDIAAGHVPSGVPLWFPSYPGSSVDTFAEAEKHARPAPSGRTPVLWQFTSDPAGPARIDQSIAYMSASDFRAWAGAATPAYEPFPGKDWFVMGRKSPIVAAMRKQLIAKGCNRYQSNKDPDVIGSGDKASYEAWMREYNTSHHKGWTGAALKWPPGPETWNALQVPKS
ncbi:MULTISPECIES: GH25 family lysozyme [Streptomyces]|uniref:GH25 family lysozyme n=1 Tax=Streptomyces TaxID=1883 RepID=UPI0033CC960F